MASLSYEKANTLWVIITCLILTIIIHISASKEHTVLVVFWWTDWSCCFNAWLTQAPLGRSSAGKQMLRSPMTTKTMADRSRGCIFQKPAQSCGPRCDKHSLLPPSLLCLWFIVHDCALHHTHKQTNTETTAFVSRACGVIICYITTSAWRAPLYFNGRAVNKCLATALMPITNC